MINFIFFLNKYKKYLLFAIVVIAIIIGSYFALVQLADERCAGKEDTERVIALEKENASLRASYAKRNAIHNEVQNAVQDITPGKLPAFTSAVLDCLRDSNAGKSCM